ncbi:serine hydrolase domain-containing protein [Pedobacter sp. KR3-3]|uniref:Serine hydrolase domain-containing protein n=1 Tax=Pedobacter albus TaxID=3113905 RepID=A0ABU7IBA7_9SPHI|nr:serine hydrolase domain-containing protein [Pedobacter sp. KR3-3]MEE1946639.1 serine hydrolase domain-containing protein [Pedobacter sp. KR3-3]
MKTFLLTTISLMLGLSLAAQTLSDNPLKTKLDSVVDKAAQAYLKNNTRVGFSIGFIDNHKKYTYNYGETAVGSHKTPTAQSIYEIGSITKTFTGLLVAHAVKEGKMDYQADIRKYLPAGFANLQYPDGKPVKVIYLIAHASKFPNSLKEDPTGATLTEAGFLQQIHEIKLDSLKEFKYAYSNVGYQLLGYVLERIYQQPYNNLVQQYIAQPLKMANTKVTFPANAQSNILKGYNAKKEEAKAFPTVFVAAGGLRSNVNDMLNYLSYQLAEKDEEIKMSHRITSGDIDKEAHAFQWSLGKTANWDYYLYTDGGTPGFRTFCMLYPDYNVGIVVLSNQTDPSAGGGLYRITSSILNELKQQKITKTK